MTRAEPVRDDLAQPFRFVRFEGSGEAGLPAIVTFRRGWRLGELAVAARRQTAGGAAETGRSRENSMSAREPWALAARAEPVAEPTGATAVAAQAKVTPGGTSAEARLGGTSAGVRAGTVRAGARRRGLVAFGTVGVVGMFLMPLPAEAAPVPCGQAERYSAQSGGQILRLTQLDVDGERVGQGVHVGDARSAMVAQASVSSAAVARMIDAEGPGAAGGLGETLQQQAPPTNAKASRRATGAADVGPVSLGGGQVSTHARWEAGMACGAVGGKVTRAGAELRGAGILADGDAALVRVPGKVASESTTELERRGEGAATVATAGLAGGDLELLGGAVKVEVVKAPSLRVSMSVQDGGEVRYLPAVIKVSGPGIRTARLDTAGDDVEITVDGPGRTVGAGPDASRSGKEAEGTDGKSTDDESTDGEGASGESGEGTGERAEGGAGLVGKLPVVGKLLAGGGDAPLPEVPGVPEVGQQIPEAAPVVEPGTRVRVQLGDVRQASQGRAIAARATAFSVTVTHGSPGQGRKSGYGKSIALAFDMGVLEAAAVAPETAGSAPDSSAGAAGGLPITGPRVDVVALSGVALVIAGAGALIFGLRGRSRP